MLVTQTSWASRYLSDLEPKRAALREEAIALLPTQGAMKNEANAGLMFVDTETSTLEGTISLRDRGRKELALIRPKLLAWVATHEVTRNAAQLRRW